MKPELQNRLLKDYPNLYRHGIYFDCDDGWFDLIVRLSNKLENMIATMNGPLDSFYARQVKEKWASLHFYMEGATEEMLETIEKFREISSRTCETCGKPGKVREGSWVTVKCDPCHSLDELTNVSEALKLY